MWLATQHGFYSIVQKPAGQFHVRTRCKQDLENHDNPGQEDKLPAYSRLWSQMLDYQTKKEND